mmetsp:Transcript_64592/g.145702  ORF Transcript_64592/g.145702 Transcript_64592/m.145702 type:complete len:826 (+) Transcript_64592:169-2646(+)
MSHATTESDHQTADVLMSLMSGKTKSNVAEPSSSPPPFPCNGGSSQNDDISADPKTASGDSSGEAHKGSVEDDEPVAENPKEPLPEQADSLERPRLDKYFFKLPHHRPLSKELAFEILTNVSIMPDAPSRPSASPFDRRFNFAYVGASKTPANLQRGPEDAANEISVSFQSIANSEPWWSQHVHDGMRLGIVARHMSRRSRVQGGGTWLHNGAGPRGRQGGQGRNGGKEVELHGYQGRWFCIVQAPAHLIGDRPIKLKVAKAVPGAVSLVQVWGAPGSQLLDAHRGKRRRMDEPGGASGGTLQPPPQWPMGPPGSNARGLPMTSPPSMGGAPGGGAWGQAQHAAHPGGHPGAVAYSPQPPPGAPPSHGVPGGYSHGGSEMQQPAGSSQQVGPYRQHSRPLALIPSGASELLREGAGGRRARTYTCDENGAESPNDFEDEDEDQDGGGSEGFQEIPPPPPGQPPSHFWPGLGSNPMESGPQQSNTNGGSQQGQGPAGLQGGLQGGPSSAWETGTAPRHTAGPGGALHWGGIQMHGGPPAHQYHHQQQGGGAGPGGPGGHGGEAASLKMQVATLQMQVATLGRTVGMLQEQLLAAQSARHRLEQLLFEATNRPASHLYQAGAGAQGLSSLHAGGGGGSSGTGLGDHAELTHSTHLGDRIKNATQGGYIVGGGPLRDPLRGLGHGGASVGTVQPSSIAAGLQWHPGRSANSGSFNDGAGLAGGGLPSSVPSVVPKGTPHSGLTGPLGRGTLASGDVMSQRRLSQLNSFGSFDNTTMMSFGSFDTSLGMAPSVVTSSGMGEQVTQHASNGAYGNGNGEDYGMFKNTEDS